MELNPLNQIEPVVILAVAVVFLVTLLALRRVYILPYIAVMQEREKILEVAETQVAEAAAIVQTAEEEARAVLDRARERAELMRREARERSERYRIEASRGAGEEIGHVLEAGRSEIATARAREVEAMRERALECVTLACEKLVGESDPRRVEEAVAKLLARRTV